MRIKLYQHALNHIVSCNFTSMLVVPKDKIKMPTCPLFEL